MSQEDVAASAAMSARQIQRLEAGEPTTVATLVCLAIAYGIRVRDLFTE